MSESGPAISGFLDQVDPDALRVVRRLIQAGHEAYLVGGCVRDLYLGRRPKDFDVATSATPEVIRRLFKNSRIIGRRFKLAHVFFGSKIIETSTFRTAPAESGADDPLIIQDNEWGTVEDDARRRDFTINALFYDVEHERIVDFVDGLDDLDGRVVRTIGNPALRFQEDPVRMIRAIKFAARLDFHIAPETWEALLEVAPAIIKCSRARLLEEMYKLLRSGAARESFHLMLEAGLLEPMMPAYSRLFGDEEVDGLTALRRALDEGETDSPAGRLWAYLEALDEYVRHTHSEVVNGVLQAVLFAPLVPDLAETSRPALDRQLERLMAPVGAALGIARRDRELARQIVLAYQRVVDPRSRRKRRGAGGPPRPHFHDVLVFLGLALRVEAGGGPELPRWRALVERPLATSEVPGAPDKATRRRRRRGGRKRKKTGSHEASDQAAADA
jgi:poly(A) polymerase